MSTTDDTDSDDRLALPPADRLTTHEVGGDLWLVDPDESGERGRWLMSSYHIDAATYR